MSSNYYKLGLNILALRKAVGKSQLEMAEDLNIKHNTISQYENGVQIPERDILLRIAKYFKITENELIYGDFSNYKKIDFYKVTNKSINERFFENMFPIICTESALKNKKFKEAYDINTKIFKDILEEKITETSFDKIEKMNELYKKSYDDGIIEGCANILWWIMLEGFLVNIGTPYNEDMIDIYSSFNEKQLTDMFVLNIQNEEYLKRNKEYEKERLKYIKDTEKDFFVNVAILKKSKDYSDLADYYIVFRYILGLYNNSLSFEMNRTIGYEIFTIYSILGNKYIKKIKSILPQ